MIKSLENFLAWLEQSVAVQEDLVDRVRLISQSLNDGWIDDVSDIVGMGNMTGGDVRKDILTTMYEHLLHLKSGISEYKAGETSATASWRQRFEAIHFNVTGQEEASDIVPELVSCVTDSERRCTRSQGPVDEYPRVQTKALEYCHK